MDNITTVNETSVVSNDLISSLVQMYLVQKMVLAPTLTDYTNLVGKGMKSISIPRAGSLQAQKKSAGQKLSSQVMSIGVDNLTLDQHYGVLIEEEDLAVVQSNIDLSAEYLKRMAAALALEMDAKIYEQMKLCSASSPDNRRAFASGSSLTKADFTTAKQVLMESNVPMDDGKLFVCINPFNTKAILDLADFVDADKWLAGSAEAKLNGVIGKCYGFQVLTSNLISNTGSIFYHSSHVSWARQIQPKFEMARNIDNLSDKMALSHNYGCKVMDNGVRGVLIGSAS